jgi:hypothetical protein
VEDDDDDDRRKKKTKKKKKRKKRRKEFAPVRLFMQFLMHKPYELKSRRLLLAGIFLVGAVLNVL